MKMHFFVLLHSILFVQMYSCYEFLQFQGSDCTVGGTHCLEEIDRISTSLIRKKKAAYLLTCKINSSE